MTVARERYDAVIRMDKAVYALAPYRARRKGQKMCHIPAPLVADVLDALHHFPWECHMEQAAAAVPDVFEKPPSNP